MSDDLKQHIEGLRAINTHSHHLKDEAFSGFDLDSLLMHSYVDWSGVKFDDTEQSKQRYLDQVRYKSYFVWLQRSLKMLYKIDDDLTPQTWGLYSDRIRNAHGSGDWHTAILKDACAYSKVILDTYWEPGSDNGHPDFFSTAFRIDSLFFGYSKNAFDHNGGNVYTMYGREYDDIDSCMACALTLINDRIANGSVCIKNASAYDRSLNYGQATKGQAQRAFLKGASPEDVKHFQDYLFFRICELAAQLDVPIQCHTGLGSLEGTRAIGLNEVIKKNPQTKFVLFHASFPWSDDVLALLHTYPNVYVDICWLPLLSPTAAAYTLHRLIEVGTADKICWGCDTWTSEESFGARLAVNSVLTHVLSEKVRSGYLSSADAFKLAENILFNNAYALYKL